jgi:hypothetical protein
VEVALDFNDVRGTTNRVLHCVHSNSRPAYTNICSSLSAYA